MASVVSNFNIKQVTNHDDLPYVGTYSVDVPYTMPDGNGNFIIETKPTDVRYLVATNDNNQKIVKLGYCCEPKGVDYPIYLTIKGQGTLPFKVGRNGIYEMQSEDWKNVNIQDPVDKTTDIIVTGVQVPEGIEFTLDYVLIIN